ncbi:MAG: response regulator transcription factor [Capsulimonadales bacterium]|nr:response regulator transcription factor [Capsulimonadales bacterium]
MEKPIRVVVAEDTTLVRRLLVFQLGRESDIRVVGEAENGKTAVEIVTETHPDIVIMDLDMPVLDGLAATEQIRRAVPSARVILVSMHQNLAQAGRLTGAAEFLPKDCTPAELLAVIRRLAASGSGPESGRTGAHDRTLSQTRQIADRFHLTDRESKVLAQLVGTEHTLGQIAYSLSKMTGESFTETSVKRAAERAMNKIGLEVRTRAALVRYVLESPEGSVSVHNRHN